MNEITWAKYNPKWLDFILQVHISHFTDVKIVEVKAKQNNPKCTQKKKDKDIPYTYALSCALASAAAFLVPFNAGKSKASLGTIVPAVRGTAPVAGAHHKAPTQG
jgi:hypothetical protein